MKILGIDLGSREVKIVVMEKIKNNFNMVYKNKISTVTFYKKFCIYNEKDQKIVVDIEKLNLLSDGKIGSIDNITKSISTGYGRNNLNLKNFDIINEVKAHAYGAIYQSKKSDFILLDIGGQDVKVSKIEKQCLTDLDLNDKCAASCGRYIENMANVLEISLAKLSNFYKEPIKLNSTCAVFSESELIGKIAEGIPEEKLCAGVNYSMYNRLKPLLSKFKGKNLIVSGGVANNKAIIKYLESDYPVVEVLQDPQFNGAIGCCYYGMKKLNMV